MTPNPGNNTSDDTQYKATLTLEGLPDDILRYTLELGFREADSFTRFPRSINTLSFSGARCNFSFLASHICRRLRRITIDTPYLWTDISTNYTFMDKLLILLERSQQAGLTVMLELPGHFTWHRHRPSAHELDRFLTAVCQHAHRWRVLYIDEIGRKDVLQTLQRLGLGIFVFPMLEELFYSDAFAAVAGVPDSELQGLGPMAWGLPALIAYHRNVPLSQTASRLRVLDLKPSGAEAPRVSVGIIRMFGNNLGAYRGLKILYINLTACWPTDEDVLVPEVIFPSLARLFIYLLDIPAHILWPLCNAIRAPGLKHLSFRVVQTRRSPEIQTLDIQTYISRFQTIHTLRISCGQYSQPVPLDDVIPAHMPHLRDLWVTLVRIEPVLRDTFLCRLRGLHTLRLEHCDGLTEDNLQSVYEALLDGGHLKKMHIKITYGSSTRSAPSLEFLDAFASRDTSRIETCITI